MDTSKGSSTTTESTANEESSRFTILTEHKRDEDMLESEDDLDETDSVSETGASRTVSMSSCHQQPVVRRLGELNGHTPTPNANGDDSMITEEDASSAITVANGGGSRFKLVHVGARFQRGRWKCWDYREKENGGVGEVDMIDLDQSEKHKKETSTVAPATNRASTSEPQEELVIEEPIVAPLPDLLDKKTVDVEPKNVAFALGGDRLQRADPPVSHPAMVICEQKSSAPLTIQTMAGQRRHTSMTSTTSPSTTPATGSNDWLANHLLPGRIPPAVSPHAHTMASTSPQWPGHAGDGDRPSSDATVNLDNKIEQAMDLVKTHLMYAVHEEVEELRSRLADTEALVTRLTAENVLLRQHASVDVLSRADEVRAAETNVMMEAAIVPSSATSSRPRATTVDGAMPHGDEAEMHV